VTKQKLDEMKKEYQGVCHAVLSMHGSLTQYSPGSAEELEDLKEIYIEVEGSLDELMKHIPHSTHDDEARFIIAISNLIAQGELSDLDDWELSTKDERAKLVRKKQADKEAKEAEELAKELGVWDEFYGSGKGGPRKGKEKGRAKGKKDEEEDGDTSVLQALILKKKKNMDGFFDSLAAKYAEPKPTAKGKRKGKTAEEDVEEPPKKKRRGAAAEPPDIDDAEFEKLQQKLFGEKTKPKSPGEGSSKKRKSGKTRKTK